jgi:hypothetical protein
MIEETTELGEDVVVPSGYAGIEMVIDLIDDMIEKDNKDLGSIREQLQRLMVVGESPALGGDRDFGGEHDLTEGLPGPRPNMMAEARQARKSLVAKAHKRSKGKAGMRVRARKRLIAEFVKIAKD